MQLPRYKPELLAPAGSEESLHAAVENGADAVYFGIADVGPFNARVRAKNIPLEKLREIVRFLHQRNVRAYLTLNTLVFSDELPQVESLLREFAAARVDAVLVQDWGVARLANRLCPSLPLHASTQMSLSSADAFTLAKQFGIRRVVLPRELSIPQIRSLHRDSDFELEAFVHGALCISFSGQCFASLFLGGRSANRGACAQACRMRYTLLDGDHSRTGQVFSPTDLAALPLLESMMDAGICSFKIEGRLKPPEYVAETTRIYRNEIDAIWSKKQAALLSQQQDSPTPPHSSSPHSSAQHSSAQHSARNHSQHSSSPYSPPFSEEMERLALAFSRGFSSGWLEGTRPRQLVPGNILAHRGIPLGTVVEVRRDAAVVRLSGAVRRGDGVLFEHETDPNLSQGGRVYEIFARKESLEEARAGEKVLLTFGNGTIDAQQVAEGQEVRKTSDSRREREILKLLKNPKPVRRIALELRVRGVVGQPLEVEAATATGIRVRVQSEFPLEEARKHPLTFEVLKEQLGRLGETVYELVSTNVELDGKAMIPLSVLGQVRRNLIDALDSEQTANEERGPILWGESLEELRKEDPGTIRRNIPKDRNTKNVSSEMESDSSERKSDSSKTKSDSSDREKCDSSAFISHLLFREVRLFEDHAMLQRCRDAGCASFYAELRDLSEYELAADSVRKIGAEFVAVAPRIFKPGDHKFLEKLEKTTPDAVLVRNAGALAFFQRRSIPCIADFSFNIVNDLAFRQLCDLGGETLHRITLGFDLDPRRLSELLQRIPADRRDRIELIVRGRPTLFSMEHCVWKANLVPPGEKCERRCRTRPLKIRDRYGALHTVRSDVHCRNFLESATPFSLEEQVPEFLAVGVRHFRFEWDDRSGFASPEEMPRQSPRPVSR